MTGDGYPEVARSNLVQVFVKVVFGVFSADGWVVIDFAVPFC